MSDRMTSIRLRNAEPGDLSLADWGRKTRPEMIAQLRRYAERQRESAEKILAAPDEELVVETYRGQIVQRGLEEVAS